MFAINKENLKKLVFLLFTVSVVMNVKLIEMLKILGLITYIKEY